MHEAIAIFRGDTKIIPSWIFTYQKSGILNTAAPQIVKREKCTEFKLNKE